MRGHSSPYVFLMAFSCVFTCVFNCASAARAAPTASSTPPASCANRADVDLFWTQLDALCDQPEAIARAQTSTTPAIAAAADQLAAHCATSPDGSAPALAAEAPRERLARIASVARAGGVPLPGPPAPGPLPRRDTLEDLLLRQLGPARPWQGGLALDLLTAELRDAICSPALAAHLPHTCAATPLDRPALPALEGALLRDALDLFGAATSEALQRVEPERRQALLLARALLTAARSGGDLVDVSRALALLARSDGAPALLARPAGAPDGAGACPTPEPGRPLSVVAHVLHRLSLEAAHLARDDGAHGERVTARALREAQLRAADHIPSPEDLEVTRALLRAVLEAHRLRMHLTPGDRAALRALAEAEGRALLHAYRAIWGTPPPLPPDVEAALAAFAAGELDAALHAALSLTSSTPETRAAIERAVQAIRRAAHARDEAEVRRILRRLVSPLGPWSEGVLFDVNLGALSLTRADRSRFAGDLTLGYQGSSWGVAFLGALSAYDYQSDTLLSETERISGELDLWYAAKGPLRVEGRVSAAFATFGTSRVDYAGRDLGALDTEDSGMFRSALLAGLRDERSPTAAWGAWIGAGLQVEDYGSVSSDALGGNFATLDHTTTTTLLLEARLRAQLALIERLLVLRARADVKRYGITRDSLGVALTAGDFVVAHSAAAHTQTEIVTRGFLDLEALRFGGFVPALSGGVDLFWLRGVESRSTVVPVFGAGVRRVVF